MPRPGAGHPLHHRLRTNELAAVKKPLEEANLKRQELGRGTLANLQGYRTGGRLQYCGFGRSLGASPRRLIDISTATRV